MHYYFYDSKSPWAVVMSDINDMVTLNVGINQISDEDFQKICKVQDVVDATDEGILEIFHNEEGKKAKPLSALIDPSKKDGKKYINACFCKDTLRVWKSDLEAKNRGPLVKAVDIQLERLS